MMVFALMLIPAFSQINRGNKENIKLQCSLDERKVTRVAAQKELLLFLTIS
jgi:hypothetical protein